MMSKPLLGLLATSLLGRASASCSSASTGYYQRPDGFHDQCVSCVGLDDWSGDNCKYCPGSNAGYGLPLEMTGTGSCTAAYGATCSNNLYERIAAIAGSRNSFGSGFVTSRSMCNQLHTGLDTIVTGFVDNSCRYARDGGKS